ncbi:MAG: hypothetical protein K2M23_01555 [Alphaproteobacteria bacterium]|nr:hypothetical protein [Alphaproteobacteria bacterium]
MINYKGNRKFIYTNDKDYAIGDYFRSNGFFYIRTGIYKYTTVIGSINSIPVLSPTSYKISDINDKIKPLREKDKKGMDYITYLIDKNITSCIFSSLLDEFCYKENNKEICFKERVSKN